jgi:3-hydroxybutyryl-CoA dehydrogenase
VGEKEETEYVALRVISRIVNEALLALSEGVATAQDIDEAMKLGANYPKGPLEWAEEIGCLQHPPDSRLLQGSPRRSVPSHTVPQGTRRRGVGP